MSRLISCALGLALAIQALPPAFAASAPPVSPAGSCVALTFDDGPDATLTPRLLDILKAEDVRATFFLVGRRIAEAPDLVRREQAEGHEIGNHTFDHAMLPSLSDEDGVAEIARTDAAIMAITGERPGLIRPPYGIISLSLEAALRQRDLLRPIALWDTDTFDWLHEDAAWTVERASAVAVGSVVLMHDIHPATIEAMPRIIKALKARGLRLTTFSDLAECLKGSPPSPPGQAARAVEVLASTGKAQPPQPSAGLLVGTLMSWRRQLTHAGEPCCKAR